MNQLELILPAAEHEGAANDFKSEFFAQGETIIDGSGLLDQMNYPEWLEHAVKFRNGETKDSDWPPSTTFLVMRKEDDRMVGIIDIRHHIDQLFLKAYGGHIRRKTIR